MERPEALQKHCGFLTFFIYLLLQRSLPGLLIPFWPIVAHNQPCSYISPFHLTHVQRLELFLNSQSVLLQAAVIFWNMSVIHRLCQQHLSVIACKPNTNSQYIFLLKYLGVFKTMVLKKNICSLFYWRRRSKIWNNTTQHFGHCTGHTGWFHNGTKSIKVCLALCAHTVMLHWMLSNYGYT